MSQKSKTHKSKGRVIASSGNFKIELLSHVGSDDFENLIKISEVLSEQFGPDSILTENTIQLYFNRDGSLPFIARFENKIIGFIIGVPIETLKKEPWANLDIHFGENNTLYTYAFVIESIYKGNGYAKMLKRVYLNWAKKQSNLKYVTGHVLSGIAKNFTGNVTILNKVTNWKNTKKVFEYYRRKLDPF